MPRYCHDCRLERDAATVGRSPCPDCGSTRVDAIAYAEPAYATVTAHPATVVTASTGQKHAQGSAVVSARPVTEATDYKVVEGEQAPEVTDALVVQGFGLWWHLLTTSPPTWMAQVFDAAGDSAGHGGAPPELLTFDRSATGWGDRGASAVRAGTSRRRRVASPGTLLPGGAAEFERRSPSNR